MLTKQQELKEQRDRRRGSERLFDVGDQVFVKTVRGECASWEEGVVHQVVSAVTYVVKVREQLRFTHADHLRSRHADPAARLEPMSRLENPVTQHSDMAAESTSSVPANAAPTHPVQQAKRHIPPLNIDCPTPSTASTPLTSTSQPEALSAAPPAERQPLRRSTRTRNPPDRFKHEDFAK
ncbi:uncharacterized protein LOC119448628 [Dermacentor silvarum]|uniref:uncharacterized protein LOC119448628 n=1 Tax=Dermacentor silvarum TaxID=543639 RepID=UPI0018979F19|nr:uncharacterized protein LOC119448628 [Dermacentor silvarum]